MGLLNEKDSKKKKVSCKCLKGRTNPRVFENALEIQIIKCQCDQFCLASAVTDVLENPRLVLGPLCFSQDSITDRQSV